MSALIFLTNKLMLNYHKAKTKMRRIFNLYMKEVNPKYNCMADLTSKFNAAVSFRYGFNAFTNKFMIQKWMSKRGEFTF